MNRFKWRKICGESAHPKRYRTPRCGGEPGVPAVRLCPGGGVPPGKGGGPGRGAPGCSPFLSPHRRGWTGSSGGGGRQVVLVPTIRLQELPHRGGVSLLYPSTGCSSLSGSTELALPVAGTAGCCWLSLNHIPQFPSKAKTEKRFCQQMTLWVKGWHIAASSKRNECFLRRAFLSPQR